MFTFRLPRFLGMVTVMLAAVLSHGEETTVFADNFNDSIRDRAKWQVPCWSEAKWQENDSRLRFFSQSTNPIPSQTAGWISRFIRKYNGHDFLHLTAKVRVPGRIPLQPGAAVTNSCEIGLGLFSSHTNLNSNFIELTLRDSASNRQFGVYFLSETPELNWTYWSHPAPTNLSIFNLRMSYAASTDTLSFHWADPRSNVWHKIRSNMKMSDLFGPAAGRKMVPYFVGYTDGHTLTPECGLWLDNYTALHVDQP